MDLTSPVRPLSAAVNAAVRLLSGPAPVRLRAGAGGVVVAGSDRDLAVRFRCAATTHTDGEALVPAAPLAETLRRLDTEVVRVVVEGGRLALRVEGARFALPLLDLELRPEPPAPPQVSEVDGSLLSIALRTVAGTAAKDDPLPLFTGVRVQAGAEGLRLTASDRYRMAVARLPLRRAEAPLDVLVPAGLLIEAARQAHGILGLHGDAGRFGLSWADSAVTTAVLDAGFLSAEAIPSGAVDTEVELDADALAAAVRRVGVYSEDRRILTLEVGDAQVRLASSREDTGEAEETLKANVCGGRTSPSFQAKYLLDALAPFSGGRVRLALQPGMRACVLRSPEPREVELTYYLMPMLPR
ncbi:DNA polymerase III subunit beta [Amycolatopsis sp. PS_44_ISF1]|uniref:DNA polymerase III subunit beta n=1 Tax=Amycolatopsis sp. PS_44_ISF1 TaxID=2974917 RepID=UPI0028DD6DD4|nr:DNA polymerase III subunit beta [Amycolatopsis sp. PS_44_ISF1]MDT8910850.1 DNA polymerase III subunit beta [Amycolatopsis sp. PS_44_ISF1]